ncbi:MAG: hypothetical protein ACP5XB_17490 [Isosphaeraceae bacterium]
MSKEHGNARGDFPGLLIFESAARVDPDLSSSLYDADHDIPRRAVVPLSRDQVRLNQRLVVSPVLTILATILAVFLIHHALRTRNVFLFVAAIFLFSCGLLLFQFHCLDCGQLGWYVYSRRHVCPAVVERCGQEHQPRIGVRPRTQFLLWIYALCAGLLGYAAFMLTRL